MEPEIEEVLKRVANSLEAIERSIHELTTYAMVLREKTAVELEMLSRQIAAAPKAATDVNSLYLSGRWPRVDGNVYGMPTSLVEPLGERLRVNNPPRPLRTPK